MIEIKSKIDCCGCTACMNICPKKAITMVEDEEGFKYPFVDKNKCINCGLCEKICPVKNKIEGKSLKKLYIIRSKNEEILKNSTSGGFFTDLAKYYISINGVVYGVAFDDDFNVIHFETKNENDIVKFQGSKYVQSELKDTFSKVKDNLKNNVPVLFSGTPCQIHGLKRYLGKEYQNLTTVDVICHGTPSPNLWKMYRKFQEKKYNSKITFVNFRNKTYGYHAGTMTLKFENGKKYNGSARVDLMLKSFFKELSSRPVCYKCKFKSINHISDFTIFDSWHASSLINGLKDDDKGYTNLVINSNKGIDLFNIIKDNYEYYESSFEKAKQLDGVMIEHCAIPSKNRDDFYKILNENGIEKAVNKYSKITIKDKIIEKSKIFLYKVGLIKYAKKIKRLIKKNKGK